MSALDDRALVRALHAYARACGGDPGRADVAAERDLEEAIDAYCDTLLDAQPAPPPMSTVPA